MKNDEFLVVLAKAIGFFIGMITITTMFIFSVFLAICIIYNKPFISIEFFGAEIFKLDLDGEEHRNE